jgi:hypothetical protein
MTTATITDERLSTHTEEITQRWIAPDPDRRELLVPAAAIHQVRRGLHLALKAACERVAGEAQQMADATADDRYVELSGGYTDALGYLDSVRAELKAVGWDQASRPVNYEEARIAEKTGMPTSSRDLSISLLGVSFGVLHDALSRVPDAAADLLETLNARIVEAREAHAEWQKRPRGFQTF